MTGRSTLPCFFVCLALIVARAAPALDLWDGRANVHGAFEMQIRVLNPDFRHEWDLAQWRFIFNTESEVALIEEPIGFLDRLSIFSRVELSYDCVWTRACTLIPYADTYGDRAKGISSKYTTGERNGWIGSDPAVNPVNPQSPYHASPPLSTIAENVTEVGAFKGKILPPGTPRARTTRLVGIGDTPPFEVLAPNISFDVAFAPFLDYKFAVMQESVTSSGGDSSGIDALIIMPRPRDVVDNVGSLKSVNNATSPILPMRPAVTTGLFHPSPGLRKLRADEDIGRFDQNFSQTQLSFNHGASQDEYELKELYADIEMFDARLFLRVGKQTIIWGKTELFRNQDLFNPTDVAIATLPSLEESRIPQWAVRAIWSAYEVGPLQDVRFELAWLFDDFEPNDIGRCGEPFSPIVVCQKTFGVFQHGALGVGLAGEYRPPNWWEGWRGHEVGARVEFRWSRFSFAISDFWHWEDQANARIFEQFVRNVDPITGLPRKAGATGSCTDGTEPACLTPAGALAKEPQNRQVFDVICASSVGFFAFLDPDVCALTITNSQADLFGVAVVGNVISAVAAGNPDAALLVSVLAGGVLPPVQLGNFDMCDGFMNFFTDGCVTASPVPGVDSPYALAAGGNGGLRDVLTDHQEGLLGCGAFWGGVGADCDALGVDLFHAEASVLFQAWPGTPPGSPVATRNVGGVQTVLRGARSPFDFLSDPAGFRYHPQVDGCIGDFTDGGHTAALTAQGMSAATLAALLGAGFGALCAGATLLEDDPTVAIGRVFLSEMEAISYNALNVIVALDLGAQCAVPGAPAPGEDCDATVPASCAFPSGVGDTAPLDCPTVQDFFSVTATTRPELRAGGNGRYGRRDFAWAGAGEIALYYNKVNTLGFAMDFAEDFTLSNWGLEFTWTNDRDFADSESSDLVSTSDVFALTISMDRPTFINFLNANRTFFINMQWFFEYIPEYVGSGKDSSRFRGFAAEGPWTALGVLNFFTGLYQDRLTPMATFVHDVQSKSGAVVLQTTYRFSARASITVGMNHFYGQGRAWRLPIGLGAIGESNQTWGTERATRLNAIREREELFLKLRYTF